jgi:hypothetical protein
VCAARLGAVAEHETSEVCGGTITSSDPTGTRTCVGGVVRGGSVGVTRRRAARFTTAGFHETFKRGISTVVGASPDRAIRTELSSVSGAAASGRRRSSRTCGGVLGTAGGGAVAGHEIEPRAGLCAKLLASPIGATGRVLCGINGGSTCVDSGGDGRRMRRRMRRRPGRERGGRSGLNADTTSGILDETGLAKPTISHSVIVVGALAQISGTRGGAFEALVCTVGAGKSAGTVGTSLVMAN